MSGNRQVKVVISGDASGVQAAADKAAGAFGKTSSAAESASHKIGGVFTKAGSMIGGEFGDILTQVGDGIDQMGEKGKNLGAKMAIGGAALAGVGALLTGVGSKEKEASNQLGAAITAAGGSMSDYKDEIEKAVKTQEGFAHSALDTKSALTVMTEATGSPKKALSEMGIVANLAAAKHESLAEAAAQVSKILGGAGAKTLKAYGITMDSSKIQANALTSALKAHESAVKTLASAQQHLTDLEAIDAGKTKLSVSQQIALRNAHDAVATAQRNVTTTTGNLASAQKGVKTTTQNADAALGELSKKLAGQASASVDSWGGRLRILKTQIGDTVAEIGQRFGPAVTGIGTALMGAGSVAQIFAARSSKAMQTAAAAATANGAATTAADGAIVGGNTAAAASAERLGVAQKAATGSMALGVGVLLGVGAAGYVAGRAISNLVEKNNSLATVTKNLSKSLGGLQTDLVNNTTSTNATGRQWLIAQLSADGLGAKAAKAGITIDHMARAIQGGTGSTKALVAEWKASGKPSSDTLVALGMLTVGYNKVTGGVAKTSAATRASTAAQRDQLTALGLNTKQAGALTAAYNRLPASKRTNLSLTGYATSMKNISDFNYVWSQLHDKTITVSVIAKLNADAAYSKYLNLTGPGKAGGGTVNGPGTSKSDSVAMMLSTGEEVIQEPYASQNRALLKAINAGRRPAPVSSGGAAAAGGSGGDGNLHVHLYLDGTQIQQSLLRVRRQKGAGLGLG